MLTTTINRYGAIAAEIYDLDKPPGTLPDTAFHLERLRSVSGPILEPACGSGRTLLTLLQEGLAVSGFDPSPEMLDRCRERCQSAGVSPELSRQRFEDFAYERRFGAIVVPVGSFTLLDTFGAAAATLRRFHDHLAPGGLLIVDIQPLRFLAETRADTRRWTATNGDVLTLEGRRVRTDWLSQRVENWLRYERWREGVLIETQIDIMAQRYWGRQEFELALAEAGFEAVQVFGGYARDRLPAANDRILTFEARRAP